MQFSLSRINRLIYRDWIVYKKPTLYGILLVVLSSLFIFWLPTSDKYFQTYDTGFWVGWYFPYLFVGGLLLASIIFWEFKNPAGRIQYLSLPASNFEKFLSRAIYPLILYPLLITVILTIAVFISKSASIFGKFDDNFWDALPFVIGGYLSLASLMLVFSITFNKYVAPKAVIVYLIATLFFVGLSYVIFRLVMHELFTGFSINNDYVLRGNDETNFGNTETFKNLVKFVIWIVIPGFFCTVAYLKMKEKQV